MAALWEEIKQRKEEANKIAAAMAKSATEKRGIFNTEEQKVFDQQSADINQLKQEIRNLEVAYDAEKSATETRATGGSNEAIRQNIGRENLDLPEAEQRALVKQQSKAFDSYLRNGLNDMDSESRSLLKTAADKEFRSLSVGGVGVVGDRAFADGLFISLKNFAGPLDAGAYIYSRSDGNPFIVMGVDDTANTAEIDAEASDTTDGDDLEASTDPTMTPVTLTPSKYSSKWVQVSLELLQDAAFGLESYIWEMASERIGRKLNVTATALITGSATVGATTTAAGAITYTDWMNFIHSLNYAYRRNKKLVEIELADTTLAKLRGMVDSQNRPIFLNVVNPQEGITEVLDGFSYTVNDNLPTLGANNVIACIAQHNKAFAFVNVVNPVVVRADQLFMQNGMVGYIVFNRYDVKLIDGRAIRTWKCAAS